MPGWASDNELILACSHLTQLHETYGLATDTRPVQAIFYNRRPGSRSIPLQVKSAATDSVESEFYDDTMVVAAADAFEADVSYRSEFWASFWNDQIDSMDETSFIGVNSALGRGMIASMSVQKLRDNLTSAKYFGRINPAAVDAMYEKLKARSRQAKVQMYKDQGRQMVACLAPDCLDERADEANQRRHMRQPQPEGTWMAADTSGTPRTSTTSMSSASTNTSEGCRVRRLAVSSRVRVTGVRTSIISECTRSCARYLVIMRTAGIRAFRRVPGCSIGRKNTVSRVGQES
jgi:hypothetical protein